MAVKSILLMTHLLFLLHNQTLIFARFYLFMLVKLQCLQVKSHIFFVSNKSDAPSRKNPIQKLIGQRMAGDQEETRPESILKLGTSW